MLDHLANITRRVPPWLRSRLMRRLLFWPLTEELIYWRAERLYREGVVHPDGGDREDEAEMYAAEGAETALRRLADHVGVDTLPGENLTYSFGLARLIGRVEADERAALETLARLGPSRRISLADRLQDYMEAADAETALEHMERISGYLEWLYQTGQASRVGEDGGAGP